MVMLLSDICTCDMVMLLSDMYMYIHSDMVMLLSDMYMYTVTW